MSKGLEALERLKKVKVDKETPFSADFLVHDKRYVDDLLIVEKELKEGEKAQFKLKALGNFVLKSKALEILKECLVSEFKLFEKDGEYFILFYFDETHELTFKLRDKEEFDLLKEVLL